MGAPWRHHDVNRVEQLRKAVHLCWRVPATESRHCFIGEVVRGRSSSVRIADRVSSSQEPGWIYDRALRSSDKRGHRIDVAAPEVHAFTPCLQSNSATPAEMSPTLRTANPRSAA